MPPEARSLGRRRALRDGLVIAGAFLSVVQVGLWVAGYNDATTYWVTPIGALYQGWQPGQPGYAYSPTFALLMAPLTLLPEPVFRVLWALAGFAALYWLARPLSAFWRPALYALCLPELINGNIHLFLAVAVALLPEAAWAWAAILLTKVTPGVAMAWHLGRREWRPFVIAGAATLGIVAVSVAIGGIDLWQRWLAMLWSNRDAGSITFLALPPLWLRICVAGVVALVGGLRDWRPAIAIAVVIALPAFVLTGATVLAALPRVEARRLRDQATSGVAATLSA